MSREEEKKEYRRQYYQRNKERILKRNAEYIKENPDKKLAISRKFYDNRRKTDPQKYLWQFAKTRAKRLGLEFSIEPLDIVIPERCPVLGVELEINSGDNAPSLDRVNPKLGYTKDNVKVISRRANRIKNDASLPELKAIIEYIENN